MIPGPANILSCPYCGGTKEVMSLISGNTCGATVWSDTRRDYPMLPEVSPIQKCPHCNKYYFIEQAKSEYSKEPNSEMSSFMKLGKLCFSELKEAREEMKKLTLTKMQRWILNHELFMAFNDCFRREQEKVEFDPSEDDEKLFLTVVNELLEGIEKTDDYVLFNAELLREAGRFQEAFFLLDNFGKEEDKWIVDAMKDKIAKQDTSPFLLLKEGTRVV